MINKLEVDFKNGINSNNLKDRRYTLTHSDKTGQRFLFIGNEFAEARCNKLKDEVIGKWLNTDYGWELQVMCTLYSEHSALTIQERYEKFKKHMPRAIAAIVNGDREYLAVNNLLDFNVNVYFLNNQVYSKEYYGRVNEYIDN